MHAEIHGIVCRGTCRECIEEGCVANEYICIIAREGNNKIGRWIVLISECYKIEYKLKLKI